jgi:hypothetical protein
MNLDKINKAILLKKSQFLTIQELLEILEQTQRDITRVIFNQKDLTLVNLKKIESLMSKIEENRKYYNTLQKLINFNIKKLLKDTDTEKKEKITQKQEIINFLSKFPVDKYVSVNEILKNTSLGTKNALIVKIASIRKKYGQGYILNKRGIGCMLNPKYQESE